MCDFQELNGDWLNDPERCVCKPAVFDAYNGMLESGASRQKALQAAQRVYLHHHPEDKGMNARVIVERWLAAQTIH